MNDQLSMFGVSALKDEPSLTSSLERASGKSRGASQVGPTSGNSGPPPVPVSRFRSLERDRAMSTNDTSGPLFTASSPSAVLQRSLENRLRARLDVNGSPECGLTWRALDMPAGPPICQLAVSGRRRGAVGSGGSQWRSPNHRENGGGDYLDPEKARARIESGHQVNLQDQMLASQWPTPRTLIGGGCSGSIERVDATGKTTDGRKHTSSLAHVVKFAAQWPTPITLIPNIAHTPERWEERNRLAREKNPNLGALEKPLPTVMMAAQWLTPRASDGEKGGPNMSFGAGGTPLPAQMNAGQWPTPTVADVEGGRATRSGARSDEMLLNGLMSRTPSRLTYRERGGGPKGENLSDQIAHIGPTPSGSNAPTEKRGAPRGTPNPFFAMWLMGFPPRLMLSILRVCLSRPSRAALKRGSSLETP
jgi:hypothetical protein